MENILVLLVFSLSPAVMVGAWFYYKDRTKEPVLLVFGAWLVGMVAVVPASVLESLLLGLVGGRSQVLDAFVVVAALEEAFKFPVTCFFVRYSAGEEIYNGILYGASVGLGFAALENVYYISRFGMSVAVVIGRALTAVPLHGLCGAMMGFYISRGLRYGERYSRLRAFLMPVLYHGSYNWGLFAGNLWGLFLVPLVLISLWRSILAEIKVSQTIDLARSIMRTKGGRGP